MAGRKKKGERLLEEAEEEAGVSNPTLQQEDEIVHLTSGGESSGEIIDETMEADALVSTLKTKRRKKRRQLEKDLISPKDDLARELKDVKKRSKQKVEESVRQEMEESRVTEVADDGTLPMPEGEEEVREEAVVTYRESEPPGSPKELEEGEESEVKRLRKKKEKVEETPIEPAEEPTEPPPRPLSPVIEPKPEPEPETKTPRMASLRLKMRDRLQKAKDEAMLEVKAEEKEHRRERREQQKKMATTRFDEDIDAEALERMTEERRKAREERKKKAAEGKLKGVYMPTAEEAFDFFTRNWDPEPEEEKEEAVEKAEEEKKEKKDEKKEGEEAKEGEEEPGPSEPKEGEEEEAKKPKPGKAEDEQPLLPEEEEDIGYGLTVVRPAEFPDPAEQEKKEAEILFYPSVSSIPATEKVEKESQPRFLEDEGFYVGTRPQTSGWNQNRMEHRLLKEAEKGILSSKKWFGEDGRLLALPDPLRATPSRPPVTEEIEPYLQTVYRKAVMSEFDTRYIDGSTEGGGHYQLDVDINQISFSHHHHYSREHVRAQRLTQLFEQYVVRQKKNMTEYLGEKLKALKGSALHLQDHIKSHTAEHSLTDRANYDRRLQDYKTEIRQTRSLRNREEQADRTLLKNIIHTWKEIKQLRDFQKFNNTSVKLQVRKEEVDKAQDQLLWKQEIEEEVEEKMEEHERKFRREMLTYEEEMAKYQKQQQAKKEAAKRRRKKGRRGSKQSQGSVASAAEETSEEQQQKDKEILEEPDLPEPEKPKQFEENTIREDVKAKAMEIRRRPGEPKLHLELSNTTSITPNATCPRGEQQRREEVSKCKVFVKILFNNKEVSRTPSKPLSQDFTVSFGQIYNLKIVQWPESITFQVYESYGLGNHLMADLCAPIPDVSVTSKSVQIEDLEFSSDHRISHSHEGVGSGLPFTFGAKGETVLTLMTTGILSFSVAWAVDEQGAALVPPMSTTNINNLFNAMKKMDPVAAIGATGVMDLQKLAKWFADSRLDPNDPSNADIVYMLRGRSGDSSQLTPAEYFRLEQLMEEFDFIDEAEFNANRRFQLLELRDGEVQEFRNYKMVPPYEKEIPRDTFTEYEKKKAEEQKLKQMEDIESHRAAVARFMQRIREQVMRRFRILAHQKRHDDMVIEEAVPNIAMLGTNLLKLTERRRPLRPERKERKKVTAQNITDVKILINIQRASNVPVRLLGAACSCGKSHIQTVLTARANSPEFLSELEEFHYGFPEYVGPYGSTTVMIPPAWMGTMGGTLTARPGELQPKGKEEQAVGSTLVRPFVEVMFQQKSVRTSVGDGPNPSFNEELELPFKAPNDDYTTSNLQTVNDNLYLNLFDEVVVDIQQDNREQGTTVHQRIEKKWLGNLKIPFSTLYFNGKIDGTFRIDAPPVLLGYTQQKTIEGEMDLGIARDNKTLLSLFITLEPPLTQAEPMKEKMYQTRMDFHTLFSTTEDAALMRHADEWKENIQARFTQKREIKTSVIDVNGKAVFVTRYFKPLKPPEEILSKGEQTADLVARYVSLIPFVSDSVIFPGLCDIWSSCDQFLQMLAGDEEEHSVLLVNYFMSIGKKAWLVCGTAIPEGPTAYVMTEEGADFLIWNSGTGEHFRTRDNNCPLQTVGCLINHENVWANIQQYEKPSQMTFNLSDTSSWEPVFSSRFPSPGLGSIQPESLYYFRTEKEYVSELQEKIQTLLKNKIMEWRSRYITRWNRHCTQIMRKLLPILEENCGKTVGEQHIHELEQSFSTYKVSGFPINMPFTEMGPIVETVFSTGVHSQESSDVEFALAVYVHPYPNSVLSVWVYVASLLRTR